MIDLNLCKSILKILFLLLPVTHSFSIATSSFALALKHSKCVFAWNQTSKTYDFKDRYEFYTQSSLILVPFS